MTKRFLLTALFAMLVPALVGCDSSDDDDNVGGGDGTANGSVTATVDGAAFQSELVTFSLESGVLSVTGITNADGSDGPTQRQLIVTVPGAAVGTATLTPATLYAEAPNADPANAEAYVALSGQVEITELSASGAAGTFSFTGTNPNTSQSVSVTNGAFDVSN